MAGEKMAFTETVKNTFKKLFTTTKIAEEGKANIVQAITEKDPTACPFPKWKEYKQIWKNLSLEEKQRMKTNIGAKDADGKIEIIPWKRKFSVLTAKHDGNDIFEGSYKDRNGNKGIKGVTYLTGRAAEQECKKSGKKKLLNDREEVMQFINFFPGETTQAKRFNFVQLFGLEKAGCWNSASNEWDCVDSLGYANLSRVYGSEYGYEMEWDDDADVRQSGQGFPSPFVVYEDY